MLEHSRPKVGISCEAQRGGGVPLLSPSKSVLVCVPSCSRSVRLHRCRPDPVDIDPSPLLPVLFGTPGSVCQLQCSYSAHAIKWGIATMTISVGAFQGSPASRKRSAEESLFASVGALLIGQMISTLFVLNLKLPRVGATAPRRAGRDPAGRCSRHFLHTQLVRDQYAAGTRSVSPIPSAGSAQLGRCIDICVLDPISTR